MYGTKFVVLIVMGFMLVSGEAFQSTLLIAYVTALLKNVSILELLPWLPSFLAMHGVSALIGSVILLMLLNYAFYYYCQTSVVKQYLRLAEVEIDRCRFRLLNSSVASLINKIPYEVLQRYSLGYIGSTVQITVRTTFVAAALFYIFVEARDLFYELLVVGVPAMMAMYLIVLLQKKCGGVISKWPSNSEKLIGLIMADVAFRKPDLKKFNEQINNLQSMPSAISNTMSNISKPLIEVMVISSLYLYGSEVLKEFFSIPAIVALVYRIYSNVTTIASLINLNSFTRASKSLFYDPHVMRTGEKSRSLNAEVEDMLGTGERAIEIRGASGSGKTVLLENLVKSLRLDGKSVYVFMASTFPGGLTIEEFLIRIVPENIDCSLDDIKKFNATTSLRPEQLLSTLSLGQKNIVGLIVACSSNCDYLIIDEPFSNLDVNTINEARKYLAEKAASKIKVLTNHSANLPGYRQVNI